MPVCAVSGPSALADAAPGQLLDCSPGDTLGRPLPGVLSTRLGRTAPRTLPAAQPETERAGLTGLFSAQVLPPSTQPMSAQCHQHTQFVQFPEACGQGLSPGPITPSWREAADITWHGLASHLGRP